MRTIYFNDKDIKESKLALVNQKLTPLQSAFLMQYITNLEEQLQQKEDIINKAIKLIHNHIKEIEELKLRIYPKEYYELLEILDNKGDRK